MPLEADIQNLTIAVKRLTDAIQSMQANAPLATLPVAKPTVNAPKDVPPLELPEAGKNAEPAERTAKATQADLRDVAQKLLAQKKLPEILRINREHGIKRITECPEDKYDAVYASLVAALGDAS